MVGLISSGVSMVGGLIKGGKAGGGGGGILGGILGGGKPKKDVYGALSPVEQAWLFTKQFPTHPNSIAFIKALSSPKYKGPYPAEYTGPKSTDAPVIAVNTQTGQSVPLSGTPTSMPNSNNVLTGMTKDVVTGEEKFQLGFNMPTLVIGILAYVIFKKK